MLDEAVHHQDLATTTQGAVAAPAPIDASPSFEDPLLQSYNAWLIYERRALIEEMHGSKIAEMPDPFEVGYFRPNNAGARFHYDAYKDPKAPRPSTRAATVLDAVGCDWINRGRRQPRAAKPDPIFALIEAEQAAWDTCESTIDQVSEAETAVDAAGLDRHPRVQVGELTTIVDGPDGSPLPQSEWKAEPIYAYSVEDIERSYGKDPAAPVVVFNGDKQARIETTVQGARESALARFEADRAALENAPEAVAYREADARREEASRLHQEALEAVFHVTPTTRAGLIAMMDLFDKREMVNVGEPHDDMIVNIFCAARAYLDPVGYGAADEVPAAAPDPVDVMFSEWIETQEAMREQAARDYETGQESDDPSSPFHLLLDHATEIEEKVIAGRPSRIRSAAVAIFELAAGTDHDQTPRMLDRGACDTTWLALDTLALVRPHLTGRLAEIVGDLLDHPDRPFRDSKLHRLWTTPERAAELYERQREPMLQAAE